MDIEGTRSILDLSYFEVFTNYIYNLQERENIFDGIKFDVVSYSISSKYYCVKCEYLKDGCKCIKYVEIPK